MKLLALDTSTDACSVALSVNEEVLVEHRVEPQKHAQLLLPMVEKLLVDAGLKITDIDGVAFGCGPGSFTGVRIAAATTQGLAFGADVGVVPVSSLQALAQGAYRTHKATHTLACFDARMAEVYWGAYIVGDDGVAESHIADSVCPPTDVVLTNNANTQAWNMLGSGADQFSNELSQALNGIALEHIVDAWPNAQDVLSVAKSIVSKTGFLAAVDAVPVYLRNRVALTEQERARGERL